MDESDGLAGRSSGEKPRTAFNLVAFVIAFLFVWVVFDNLALGLIAGLLLGGGAEIAQRAARRPRDQ